MPTVGEVSRAEGHDVPVVRRAAWYVLLGRFVATLIALAALAVFCRWAYVFALRPVPDPHHWAHDNFRLGNTIRFYLRYPSLREPVIQLGGNLLLLAPLGVLLPLISRRFRGLFRLAFSVALVSLAIEIVQGTLISGRTFDVDDIVLNILGAVLAYLFAGRWLSRRIHGRKP
jgi:glycopeptide antibiotics resistance protein